MANKVKSLLGGPGFYAVLALCVLAVGVGGYFLLFGEPAQTEAPTGPDTAASAPVADVSTNPALALRFPPLEVQAASYLAASVRIDSFSRTSISRYAARRRWRGAG